MIGYHYFRHRGSDWRQHHGALIPLGMPHVAPSLSFMGALQLLIARHALFIRWDEGFDQFGGGEWWHVIKDVPEDFPSFSKKMKNQVRRGLKFFDASPASRSEIFTEGYPVYCSAFDRYETFEEMFSEQAFHQAIMELPADTEFWAVRSRTNRKMLAFSENLVRDGACFYDTMWFEPEALSAYAGYVLIHEMNKHYLNERRLKYVSDGARSISHQTNVHAFLEQKFGFRRAYSGLRLVYFPGFGLVVHLLYPFRRWLQGRSQPWIQKASVVLEQERIRRACAANRKEA